MAINLQKGQTINLDKDQFDLSKVTIGLGWDVRKKQGGSFLGKLLGGAKEEEYDLDAIAFLLDVNEKVIFLGDEKLSGSDVIFFNNMRHPSGNIWLTGDNRTGAGDGDDEQIIVQLNALDTRYQKILFMVSIYEGIKRGQNFGAIENAFIRAVDGRGREMAKYSLSGDNTFATKHSMVFAELYRRDGSWKFRAIGNALEADSFVPVLREHLPNT